MNEESDNKCTVKSYFEPIQRGEFILRDKENHVNLPMTKINKLLWCHTRNTVESPSET